MGDERKPLECPVDEFTTPLYRNALTMWDEILIRRIDLNVIAIIDEMRETSMIAPATFDKIIARAMLDIVEINQASGFFGKHANMDPDETK